MDHGCDLNNKPIFTKLTTEDRINSELFVLLMIDTFLKLQLWNISAAKPIVSL